MKRFNIVHHQQILANVPAESSFDALKRFREMQFANMDLKIKHAEEMVEFLKRERQWDAEHPLDLEAHETP